MKPSTEYRHGIPVHALDLRHAVAGPLFAKRDLAVRAARFALLSVGVPAGIYEGLTREHGENRSRALPHELPLDDLMGLAAERYEWLERRTATDLDSLVLDHVVGPLSTAFAIEPMEASQDPYSALIHVSNTWHESAGCRCGRDRRSDKGELVATNRRALGRLHITIGEMSTPDRIRAARRARELAHSEWLREATVGVTSAARDRLPTSVVENADAGAHAAVRTFFQRLLRPRAETAALLGTVRAASMGILMNGLAHPSFARALHEALEPVLSLNEILAG